MSRLPYRSLRTRISWRDRLAHRLANAAMRLATPWYRAMVAGAVAEGLHSAAFHAVCHHRWDGEHMHLCGLLPEHDGRHVCEWCRDEQS